MIIDIKLTRKPNLFFSLSSCSVVCVIANAPYKSKALHTLQNSNLTHRHKSDNKGKSVTSRQGLHLGLYLLQRRRRLLISSQKSPSCTRCYTHCHTSA